MKLSKLASLAQTSHTLLNVSPPAFIAIEAVAIIAWPIAAIARGGLPASQVREEIDLPPQGGSPLGAEDVSLFSISHILILTLAAFYISSLGALWVIHRALTWARLYAILSLLTYAICFVGCIVEAGHFLELPYLPDESARVWVQHLINMVVPFSALPDARNAIEYAVEDVTPIAMLTVTVIVSARLLVVAHASLTQHQRVHAFRRRQALMGGFRSALAHAEGFRAKRRAAQLQGAALRALQHRTERAAWNAWSEHSAAVAAARLSQSRAIRALLHRGLLLAVNAWIDHAAHARETRASMTRAVNAMNARGVLAALNTWREVAAGRKASRRRLTSALGRMRHKGLAACFQSWAEAVRCLVAAHEVQSTAFSAICRQRERVALNTWFAFVDGANEARQRAIRALARLSPGTRATSRAFACWCSIASVMAALQRAGRRLRYHGVSRGFNRWVAVVDAAAEQAAIATRALCAMSPDGRACRQALNVLIDMSTRAQVLQRAVTRLRLRSAVGCVHAWRAHALARARMRCVIVRMRHVELNRHLRKWAAAPRRPVWLPGVLPAQRRRLLRESVASWRGWGVGCNLAANARAWERRMRLMRAMRTWKRHSQASLAWLQACDGSQRRTKGRSFQAWRGAARAHAALTGRLATYATSRRRASLRRGVERLAALLRAPPGPMPRALLHRAQRSLLNAFGAWLSLVARSTRQMRALWHWHGKGVLSAFEQWAAWSRARGQCGLEQRRRLSKSAHAAPLRDLNSLRKVFRGWRQSSRERALREWAGSIAWGRSYWEERLARAVTWRPSSSPSQRAVARAAVAATAVRRSPSPRTRRVSKETAATNETETSTATTLSPSSPSAPGSPMTPLAPIPAAFGAAQDSVPHLELPSPTTSFAVARPRRRLEFLDGGLAAAAGAFGVEGTGSASPIRACYDLGKRRAQIARDRIRSNWSETLRR